MPALPDNSPWSDRRLARTAAAPLDIAIMVAIQKMDCDGKRPGEILAALAGHGVTMDGILRLIAPSDERAGAGRPQGPARANLGFASFKERMR